MFSQPRKLWPCPTTKRAHHFSSQLFPPTLTHRRSQFPQSSLLSRSPFLACPPRPTFAITQRRSRVCLERDCDWSDTCDIRGRRLMHGGHHAFCSSFTLHPSSLSRWPSLIVWRPVCSNARQCITRQSHLDGGHKVFPVRSL